MRNTIVSWMAEVLKATIHFNKPTYRNPTPLPLIKIERSLVVRQLAIAASLFSSCFVDLATATRAVTVQSNELAEPRQPMRRAAMEAFIFLFLYLIKLCPVKLLMDIEAALHQ